MLTEVEQASAYLQRLEADRLAAIAASEEKAQEAKLIKARQEGFQEAMKLLGMERSTTSVETKQNETERARRRNIAELILTELSFSGTAMTTKQIAVAIDYFVDRTEGALKRLENARQVVRDQDDRWTIPVTTVPQHDSNGVVRANGKSFIGNGRHGEATQ